MGFASNKRLVRRHVRESTRSEWAKLAFAEVARLLNREEAVAAKKILVSVTEEEDDPRLLAEAWIRLAELLEREGSAACGHAYRWVAEYADPVNTPGIMVDLAAYLERSGHSDRALGIYEEVAFVAADPQLQAVALFRLGEMRHRQEDHLLAIAYMRTALLYERDRLNSQIALRLAEVLVESSAEGRGGAEWNEAEKLLQRVIETDHPDCAPAAALLLSRLRRLQDQPAEAERLCKLVIASEHPDFVAEAHALQSELIYEQLGISLREPDEADPPDPSPDAETSMLWIAPGPSPGRRADLLLPRSAVRPAVGLDREGWRRILFAVRGLLGLVDPSLHPPPWTGCVRSPAAPEPPQEAVESKFLWTVNALISHPYEQDFELWLMPPNPESMSPPPDEAEEQLCLFRCDCDREPDRYGYPMKPPAASFLILSHAMSDHLVVDRSRCRGLDPVQTGIEP